MGRSPAAVGDRAGVIGGRVDGRRSAAWRFGWLWTAYGVSTFGTRFAFDAFALVALLVLHAGPAQVSLLAAVGPAVGAVLSVPLGPWVEYRRKRPVMIATDLVRCAVLLSVPFAYALDALTVAQLLVVSVTVAAADITFQAAVGAYVKDVVPREELLRANGRLESTTWTATMLGPPLGGAAIGWFGPVTTVVADAVSYLLSAGALGAAGGGDRRPDRPEPRPRLRAGDLFDGWRYILRSRDLRPLFLNTVLVNGLIMASSPLLAVLMVGPLGFAPWQYGLAFAAPFVEEFLVHQVDLAQVGRLRLVRHAELVADRPSRVHVALDAQTGEQCHGVVVGLAERVRRVTAHCGDLTGHRAPLRRAAAGRSYGSPRRCGSRPLSGGGGR
ncbi:MFS transporter [Streptomyces werraensis]|uniref:MFS transporter n=1 Tax=Streptomyces werraensis TaxID=68284 RepID=UPI0036FFEDC2